MRKALLADALLKNLVEVHDQRLHFCHVETVTNIIVLNDLIFWFDLFKLRTIYISDVVM